VEEMKESEKQKIKSMTREERWKLFLLDEFDQATGDEGIVDPAKNSEEHITKKVILGWYGFTLEDVEFVVRLKKK